MATARPAVRRQLRARRRELSEGDRRDASAALVRVAAASGVLRRRRRIAFYLPHDGEIDVLPLLLHVFARKRRCYLPVLDTMSSRRLWFTPWKPGERLVHNHFGIAEPARGARRRASPADLDLILLPLVAFDDRGNRLGMGGGYYDRTLAFLKRRRHWRRPAVYGVAYGFQRVTELEPAPWDVPLDGCLTELGLHLFPAGNRGR